MTTVITIDPSLSASGITVWRTGRPLFIDTIRTSLWGDINGWDASARHDRISRQITNFVDPDNTIVTMEGIIKPSMEAMRGMSTLDLAQLRGVIMVDLYRLRVPVNLVHPSTLKAFVKPGRCTKADMVSEARSVLGAQFPIDNDNEADAFWLLAMTMQAYGFPIVRQTVRRKRFVKGCTWWHHNMQEATQ